jgi:hypothetical protein
VKADSLVLHGYLYGSRMGEWYNRLPGLGDQFCFRKKSTMTNHGSRKRFALVGEASCARKLGPLMVPSANTQGQTTEEARRQLMPTVAGQDMTGGRKRA